MVEEKKRETDFWDLQGDILEEYGTRVPEPPKLEVRLCNVRAAFLLTFVPAPQCYPNLCDP